MYLRETCSDLFALRHRGKESYTIQENSCGKCIGSGVRGRERGQFLELGSEEEERVGVSCGLFYAGMLPKCTEKGCR